jgi:hypothetical protein
MKTNESMTSQESLDLITRMLRNTQERFERGAGTPFLVFGYLTVAASLAVWSLIKATGDFRWSLLWFSIPVIGIIWLLFYLAKKPKTVTTFIDRAVGQVWFVLGSCGSLIAVYSGIAVKSFPILMIISLFMFSGVAITGGIIKLRYVQILGFIGIFLSFGIPFVTGMNQIFCMAALAFFVMVIPGHIMNAQARKRVSEAAQTDGHV